MQVFGESASSYVESGFEASKLLILASQTESVLANSKSKKDDDLEALQMQTEVAESLVEAQQIISVRLKQLGSIQMQGYRVPYELKPSKVERGFFT